MRKPNPEETPEQHVHESVGRQKKAAENVAKTAERVAKKAESKAEVLARATDLLSNRVVTLADAVQTNNAKIDKLQKEVNKKPDDEELKFFETQARRETSKFFVYAFFTALIAALIAGTVAYYSAKSVARHNCQNNAANIETIVSILDTPQLRKAYAEQIKDLRSDRNICE